MPATRCDWSGTDHATCYLEVTGLTCNGAPYDFGVFSFRAQTCGGPEALCGFQNRCGRAADFPGLSFVVTKQDLGCPIPPTEACNGDASCEKCLSGGVGVGGGGPGAGGPGAPGNPPAGGGAYLYYAAGGAGHSGLPGSVSWNATLGRHWSHSYAGRIVVDPDTPEKTHVWLITRYATFREWSDPDPVTGVYRTVSPSNEYRTLTWTGAGWTLEELDGAVHAFDGGGLWLSTTDRNGNSKTAVYSGGLLTQVHFPDDRREDFTYYPAGDPSEGKLETITEVGVDGATVRTWRYGWSGDDLVRVDRPDATAIVYSYGDGRFPGYLTRIELEGTDGTSTRVERAWEYDDQGNVRATWRGDPSKSGPNAVDLWQLAFDDPAEPTVTDPLGPLGQAITYEVGRDTVSPNVKVLSITGDCPVCGLGPNVTMVYEDPLHPGHPLLPKRIIDGRGIETSLVYTDHGQVASRTDAANVDPETHPHLPRTTTWTYDPVYPGLVTSIETPSVVGGTSLRTTEWLREDAPHNPTTLRITGVERGSAFVYDTVTDFNGAGQPLTVDPPGHGTADRTTWSYTPPVPGDPDRGGLFPFTRTDPLVGDTTFGYDPVNRRTSVIDPNGIETKTGYDALDRVTEVRQVGESPPNDDLVTGYRYTVFGDLFQTVLPEDNVIEYGYDTAGRLVSVERKPDALPESHGERTFYTLDAAGNRTLEELQRWDADGSAYVALSATEYRYANRCQVERVIQAPGAPEEAVTEYAYDCNGNLSQVWDPNHLRLDPVTQAELPETALYQYDAVDRLTSVTQPWGGSGGGFTVTTYEYDVQDHLVGVTDAEGNTTTYTYSDRDLLSHELTEAFVDPLATCSPAPACDPGCGCTAHTYDEHGALDTTLDARGVLVDRVVDALDRVLGVDYPGAALDISYSYDTEPVSCGGTGSPIGRLGSITRDGQALEYCYDRFGRVTGDGDLTYQHDKNGNRTIVEYPGGVSATYGYDFADRPASASRAIRRGSAITPGATGRTGWATSSRSSSVPSAWRSRCCSHPRRSPPPRPSPPAPTSKREAASRSRAPGT